MSPAGVELIHMVISGALKQAVRLELIFRNPAQAVTPPRGVRREIAPPAVEDIRRILERGRMEGHWLFPALHLSVFTGARRGEVLGLRWRDLDVDRGTATITQSVVRAEGGVLIEPTKTERSRRTIDLDPETVSIISAHRVRQLEHRLKMGRAYADDVDLIFADPLGGPCNPYALTRLYQNLAKKEGVPRSRLHDLRHLHASMLFQQGESLHLVSQRLGHSSVVTTADIYGHLMPGQGKKAAEAVAGTLHGG